MNDSLTSTIVWCVLQISLVSMAGVVASVALGRRKPFAASSAIVMASVVCGCLTLLAPFPVHRWFFVAPQAKVAVTQATAFGFSRHNAPGELTEGDAARGPLFAWRELAVPLQMLATHADRWEQQAGATVHGGVWLLALAAGFGCWRFALGMAYVVRIGLRSAPIQDEHLSGLLHDVAKRLACRRIPDLRESSEFLDAAVAGWLRPAVILPAGWRDWSDEECRSVLAHEVAHVVGRDALWRLVTASVLAMHFYNPLLHWLFRRLMLCQELASDALAASAVGGRCYLRSLSSLALRQDDRLGSGAGSGVLPVFSGDLIRRIKMLSSTQDDAELKPVRRRSVVSGVMFLTFLATGLAAVATRGIAQPPNGEKKSAQETARRVSLTKVIPDSKPEGDPTEGMFRRTPIDSQAVGATNPSGMVALRVHEYLMRPEIQGFLPFMNAACSESLAKDLKTVSAPAVSLEAIEWIAARPQMTFTAKTGEEKSRLMFGGERPIVRLNQPFDLKRWFEQFAPDTPRAVVEGKDVFAITLTPLGPVPLGVWMEDEWTIRFGNGQIGEFTAETTLAELAGDKKPPQPSAGAGEPAASEAVGLPWAAAWGRIDHGLASVIFAKVDYSELLKDFEQREDFQTERLLAMGRAIRSLASRAPKLAVSCDVAEKSAQAGLRVSCIHGSREEALQSADDIRELLTLAKAEFAKESPERQEKGELAVDVGVMRLYEAAFQEATISVDEYDDRTAAVVVSTAIPFGKLLEVAFNGEAQKAP